MAREREIRAWLKRRELSNSLPIPSVRTYMLEASGRRKIKKMGAFKRDLQNGTMPAVKKISLYYISNYKYHTIQGSQVN